MWLKEDFISWSTGEIAQKYQRRQKKIKDERQKEYSNVAQQGDTVWRGHVGKMAHQKADTPRNWHTKKLAHREAGKARKSTLFESNVSYRNDKADYERGNIWSNSDKTFQFKLQEGPWFPSRIDTKKFTYRHTAAKLRTLLGRKGLCSPVSGT